MLGLRVEVTNFSIIGQRIREVVADQPKAFAYDVGISLSATYNYMNGRLPRIDILFRIARYAGKPMEWFLDPNFDAQDTAGGSVIQANGHDHTLSSVQR